MGSGKFDLLRSLTEHWVPGAGTLYFTLALIWGWPFREEVVASAAALTTFLGIFLGISRQAYNKSDASSDGELLIDRRNPAKDLYTLHLNRPFEELNGRGAIKLTIQESGTK